MPYYPNFLSKDPAGLTSAAGGQGIQVYAYNSNDPNLPRPWLDAVARGKYGGFADARLRFKKNYYSDGGARVPHWEQWQCEGRTRQQCTPWTGDCGGHADKGGRPLFSKREEQNLRDWGYNLDRLHKLEHKYKF